MTTQDTRATVRLIAEDTGVSIATVSRVLNNHVNVAPRTRELVLQAVERRRA
ncbi:MAG: LacI family DNA-binding transcriptional regulator, partial [Actinomycetota bacterium]|nr:LacI family DNA-binding transcriptional regulator [Actinomycetota bacterium]